MNPALSRRSFDGLHGHLVQSPSAKLIAFKGAVKVRDIAYLPGEPRFAGDRLNLWTATAMSPVAGDCSLIWDLIEHLFPAKAERDHILDVLAFHVANPAAKIHHAMMIRGPQGSGKNTLFDSVLAPIVGAGNLRVLSGEALASRFNSELVNVQVLVIDEVVHRNGWEIANALKPLITDDTILAEAKGESRRSALTPRVTVILSNDPAPLPLETTDRRYFAPGYGPEKLSGDFYDRLHASLLTAVPAFFHDLLNRDIRGFNPASAPPITAGKAELQAAVRPPLERQIREMIDDRRGAFACDIVLPQSVMMEVRLAGHTLATEQAVAKALKDSGALALGQLPLSPRWAGRPRCWAIRRQEELGPAGAAAWARLLGHGNPAQTTHSAHGSSLAAVRAEAAS
jgi:hypothetical protein